MKTTLRVPAVALAAAVVAGTTGFCAFNYPPPDQTRQPTELLPFEPAIPAPVEPSGIY